MRRYLVECGGELLMVFPNIICLDDRDPGVLKFCVFKMDFIRWHWVETKSPGGQSIFFDIHGCTVSENPGSWGGRGDCIYESGLLIVEEKNRRPDHYFLLNN
ncbi:hypothetical protein QJS10_CPB22g01371 [Acorus calamus]|uniref:KIB1-4 beta-propeller domain-containing protein n=1 Tax=Acorus calamus TaxID=4465 RepID=A0AAV9C012_ACOCL|nr:hypothetical protein QJS10_CPB22g01371 [Acorus calamus]